MNEVDAIRIEQFRQFKKEIRGSREYEVVGIDVAKEKHHAFFGTAMGKTLLRRLVFENDLEGFCKLIEQAEALRVQEGLSKVVYGLEPTGDYHKPLGEHLIKCAKLVVLVSGVALREEPGASGRAVGQARRQGCGQRGGSDGPGQVHVLRIPGLQCAGSEGTAISQDAAEEAGAWVAGAHSESSCGPVLS